VVETFGDAGAAVGGGANGDIKTEGLSSPTTRVGGVIGVAEGAGRGESRQEVVGATKEGTNHFGKSLYRLELFRVPFAIAPMTSVAQNLSSEQNYQQQKFRS